MLVLGAAVAALTADLRAAQATLVRETVEPAVLPRPAKLTPAQGQFTLSRATVIITDDGTRSIGLQLARSLAPALGFDLRVGGRDLQASSAIVLALDPWVNLGPEGYALDVSESRVLIRGAAPAGVFYGTQTVRQLLPPEIFSQRQVSRDWTIPAVGIEDAPRFGWRGLMLDASRHFIPKADVLTFIDLLALHKMNVLHWHLTDDQGWRIEIKKYPKLTSVGAWRKETRVGHELDPKGFDGKPHGGFYSQVDIREVVAYARERFVTIVPEIEMPGHAQAAVAAYPELGVTGEPVEVSTRWGINPYLFNTKPSTIRFLQDVLGELILLFPGAFIHVGGDEAIKDQWQASAETQARIKELGLKDEHQLQSWFIKQMDEFLTSRGRRLIGWDEILEGGLAPGAAVMSWRGTKGGIEAARAGHDVVMAPTTHVYFDYYQSNDPSEPLAIGGYAPLEKVYAFEPVPEELSPHEARRILGAQAQLWSEYLPTAAHIQYMAFPRAIALAEVTWTPAARRDFTSFRARLSAHEARLTALGVKFRPVSRLELEPSFAVRPRE
jgi:hexosaminidase